MKKAAFKLHTPDPEIKQKAMKEVISLPGFESIRIDPKDKKPIVTGYMDPEVVLAKLSKICHTEIVQVRSAKAPEEEEKEEENETPEEKKVEKYGKSKKKKQVDQDEEHKKPYYQGYPVPLYNNQYQYQYAPSPSYNAYSNRYYRHQPTPWPPYYNNQNQYQPAPPPPPPSPSWQQYYNNTPKERFYVTGSISSNCVIM